MKQSLRTPLMAVALAFGSGVIGYAQTAAPTATQAPANVPMQHAEHHRADPARQTQMLTKHLGLTADQAAQVQPILEAREQQMEALHAAPSADHKAMQTQRQAIMADTDQKLNAVFNDQQKQQFAAMKARHHGHEGGPSAPATPPPGV